MAVKGTGGSEGKRKQIHGKRLKETGKTAKGQNLERSGEPLLGLRVRSPCGTLDVSNGFQVHKATEASVYMQNGCMVVCSLGLDGAGHTSARVHAHT